MAQVFDSATRAALEAGNVSFRTLAQFELDDGVYRFGNHTPGELISALGESWYGVGGLASVSDLTTATGLAADEATISVNGAMVLQPPAEYANTASWFRDMLKRDMLNRRCTIYELVLQADTGAPLFADSVFSGPIDRTPLNLGTPQLSIRIRSNRQALGWPTGRSRSDADQRRVDPRDGALRHVGDVSARQGKMPWGFVPSGQSANTRGGRRGGGGGGRSDQGGRYHHQY